MFPAAISTTIRASHFFCFFFNRTALSETGYLVGALLFNFFSLRGFPLASHTDLLVILSQIELEEQIQCLRSSILIKKYQKGFEKTASLSSTPVKRKKKLKWSPNASPFIIHAERWHFLRILIKIMMNTCVGILWQDSIIHHNLLSTLKKTQQNRMTEPICCLSLH